MGGGVREGEGGGDELFWLTVFMYADGKVQSGCTTEASAVCVTAFLACPATPTVHCRASCTHTHPSSSHGDTPPPRFW